ncbi:unnamed protein product [Paramecium octaurelia]|uniref:PH domain-containing protein n=1 Tax=Paramecium octaurelia TaxID=43137 RepID=A0A8S1VEH0_PAROT|nr:unnamed protein product [Paramecium octaurelia]
MEGYLLKWTNIFQRWQPRYFILYDDILTYCEQKGSSVEGRVSLKISGIFTVQDDPLEILIQTGTNELKLKANAQSQFVDWFKALQIAQEKSQKNKVQNFESQINDLLSTIWVTFAAFDETLNTLQINCSKFQYELITKLHTLGQNLKTFLTLGFTLIEQEKERFENDANSVYESFNEMQSVIPNNGIPKQIQIKVQEFESPQRGNSFKSILESIKHTQPIKYRNLVNSPVFTKIYITDEPERTCLPYKQDPKEKFNVWPFLKSCIGKDLTRIPFPLIFHQPMSVLQLIVQQFAYFDQIKKASQCEDSCKRMCHIIAFTLSRCSSTLDGQKKPFNPLLGETFEFLTPDYSIVCEQVSHHPPVSVMHCEGKDFKFWSQNDASIGFGGTHIKIQIVGKSHIYLKRYNEHYTFDMPNMHIKNLVFGEKYFEHVGKLKYINHQTGDVGIVDLREYGEGKNFSQVQAEVRDSNHNLRYQITGFYNSALYVGNELLWQRIMPTKEAYYYYNYIPLQMQANYLNTEILLQIPCTDSRLRPDIAALEHGWKEIGQDEKVRMEEKQREKRRIMEQRNEVHVPKFFEIKEDFDTKTKGYVFKGNYWTEKHEVMDIF